MILGRTLANKNHQIMYDMAWYEIIITSLPKSIHIHDDEQGYYKFIG